MNNLSYYFYLWEREENESFDSLVNDGNTYNHKQIIKQTFANDKKIPIVAIVSKFANDK